MEIFRLGNHYLKDVDIKDIEFKNEVEEEKKVPC